MNNVILPRSQKGNSAVIVLLLIAILGVLLMISKPDEKKLRQQVAAEFGLAGGVANLAGSIGQLVGAVTFEYRDCLFFSILYMQLKNGPEEIIAVGFAGQAYTRDTVADLKKAVKEQIDKL